MWMAKICEKVVRIKFYYLFLETSSGRAWDMYNLTWRCKMCSHSMKRSSSIDRRLCGTDDKGHANAGQSEKEPTFQPVELPMKIKSQLKVCKQNMESLTIACQRQNYSLLSTDVVASTGANKFVAKRPRSVTTTLSKDDYTFGSNDSLKSAMTYQSLNSTTVCLVA
ncbi:hypothetical protein CSKR_109825 [Clonorchis sinensis]|uniref:Uncharacterized protein n=1 Tax=Clonorchis sinensis TaxID=79923 RepID=A0A419QDM7_CLOSI|nr:hypothetical protein CSKR_109825 [Clonorchis sinensis]